MFRRILCHWVEQERSFESNASYSQMLKNTQIVILASSFPDITISTLLLLLQREAEDTLEFLHTFHAHYHCIASCPWPWLGQAASTKITIQQPGSSMYLTSFRCSSITRERKLMGEENVINKQKTWSTCCEPDNFKLHLKPKCFKATNKSFS